MSARVGCSQFRLLEVNDLGSLVPTELNTSAFMGIVHPSAACTDCTHLLMASSILLNEC